MNITRDEAAAQLKRGFPVIVNGELREPTRAQGGAIIAPAAGTLPESATFIATRHEDGHFTRAGLEDIIRRGGSVSHGGVIIERIEDLPTDDVLAAGDVKRLEEVRRQQDEVFRQVVADRDRTAAELDRARAAAERAKGKKSDDDAAGGVAAGGPNDPNAPPGLGTPLGAPKIGSVSPPHAPATTEPHAKPRHGR